MKKSGIEGGGRGLEGYRRKRWAIMWSGSDFPSDVSLVNQWFYRSSLHASVGSVCSASSSGRRRRSTKQK